MIKLDYVNGAHGQTTTLKKEQREYKLHVAFFCK